MSTTTRVTPTVTKLKKINGVAGQFAVRATVAYPGEDPQVIEFVGSAYGGPVLMVTDAGQTWVTDPGRFGSFGTDWVRKFFR
jgi:hypothetical protein